MPALNWIALLLTHPLEFRTLLQFWLYHEQKRDIRALTEHPTSGWDRATMRRCWEFLDFTSRSFSAVIKELEGDLARTIALFYLVLRGLDTVEDDMTIPDHIKQPILRSFHIHTVTPGWKFDGCGPHEKDRQLLVEYDTVVEEVNQLLPAYKAVIIDICQKMQTGMADYAHKAATTGTIYLSTISEYDLYCHYVAGLVGEGLSRLFAASGKESPNVGHQLELSNSMGIFLQKTNIIRDFREDADQQRFFWPKEIWGQYGFTKMEEIHALDPSTANRAQWAQSGMIVDALRHACDALDYLRMIRNQSVFNFCAIPATMAIATLELCFMNPAMLQRNVKIRKAEAANLIMRSTNPREVGLIFREFARKIHAKAIPADPNFIRVSVACGKIEQWCEQNYPSFIHISTDAASGGTKQSLDPSDVRTRIVQVSQAKDAQLLRQRRALAKASGNGKANGQENGKDNEWIEINPVTTRDLVTYMLGAFACITVVSAGIVWAVLKWTGDL